MTSLAEMTERPGAEVDRAVEAETRGEERIETLKEAEARILTAEVTSGPLAGRLGLAS